MQCMCVLVCSYVGVCRGQRLPLGVFLHDLPLYVIRQGLWLGHRSPVQLILASLSRDCLSVLPNARIIGRC